MKGIKHGGTNNREVWSLFVGVKPMKKQAWWNKSKIRQILEETNPGGIHFNVKPKTIQENDFLFPSVINFIADID